MEFNLKGMMGQMRREKTLKAAQELPADLIVMRTARRNQPSTNGREHSSLQILLQAPCPVLSIPESDGFQIPNNAGSQQDGFYVGQPEARSGWHRSVMLLRHRLRGSRGF
jgi:hypothetical protein